MKKNCVLKLSESRGVFLPALSYCESENIGVATIKNKVSALKKFVRNVCDETVIIASGESRLKLYENKIKEYTDISEEVIIAVIEKICRQSAKKFSMPIPFGEIYIVASSPTAFCIINALKGLSRLFTIVSPYEVTGRMYDELYFKHGTLIRHIPYFNNEIRSDAIVIRCIEDDMHFPWDTVLIDLCKNTLEKKSVLAARNVYIYDESIAEIQKLWGGKSNASLYTLTEKIPGENAVVDIDERTDKIFLLDIDAF